MNEIKQKALDKMLQEMEKKHSANEDAIHNWLCDQEDDQLFEGIIKEGKSIKGAMLACKDKAKSKASNGVAMIDDKTVFGCVYHYFTGKKKTISSAEAAFVPKPKKRKRKSEPQLEGAEQMDLFDSL
ncbi:MAG: Cas9 inhibitor AcrIIA9 family protein [Enterococcus sp.]